MNTASLQAWSVMTWERGHPARIFLHFHPVRILQAIFGFPKLSLLIGSFLLYAPIAVLNDPKLDRNLCRQIKVSNCQVNHVGEGVHFPESTGSILHDFNDSIEALGDGI